MTRNKNQSNLTVFGEETVFSGVLEYTDNLVITGKFEGTIKSTGNLEIAKTAECIVDSLSANEVIIAGKVKGNIFADTKLEMSSGSMIEGDISTKKLRIADNVDFKGKVSMFDKLPDVDIFSVNSTEYKDAVQGKAEKESKSDEEVEKSNDLSEEETEEK